jgi:glycosyltransferase involved in cell wall biosynthesis
LHPQKGYPLLISVAARWRNSTPPIRVVIAGSGPAYDDLTRLIAAETAPVTLLGHRSDVSELLSAADVAVVTSVWEGSPLFTQEALRAGVPLVATAVGGVPNLVGDAAIVIPPGDADALDRAVTGLLANPGARADYAQRGPAQAARWPTVTDMVDQIAGVYAPFFTSVSSG